MPYLVRPRIKSVAAFYEKVGRQVEFIGECYLLGYMAGEAIEEVEDKFEIYESVSDVDAIIQPRFLHTGCSLNRSLESDTLQSRTVQLAAAARELPPIVSFEVDVRKTVAQHDGGISSKCERIYKYLQERGLGRRVLNAARG